MPDETVGDQIITEVRNCARCGKYHDSVTFTLLQQPVNSNGIVYSYWGTCPNTGEPILLAVYT